MMFRSLIRVFYGCLLFSAPGWTAEPLDRVRLQLKWQHQFQFAGYYAAVEKGYYAEEGLEVELLTPEKGVDPMQVVVDGDAEFGVSTSDLVKMVAAGDEVVALAVIYQHSPYVLVSLMEAGIESMHDLAGKKIMIEPNAADLVAMFKAEGIAVDSITMVKHDFDIRSLVDGEVDAMSAYVTDEPFALRERGLRPIVITPRAAGIDFYGDGIFTTREQVENHPERVAGFRRASLRGWEYALSHPEEIISLIREKYSDRKSVEALRYEAYRTMRLVRPDLVEVGYMNPGRWAYISEVFLDLGLVERAVHPTEFVFHLNEPFPWRQLLLVISILFIVAVVSTVVAFLLYRSRQRLKRVNQHLIEAKKSLDESEGFYRNVYENAPFAFILWDSEFRILRWNNGAERIFGWAKDEVLGRRFPELMVPEEERSHVLQINSDIERDGLRPAENWNLRKDGTRIWCQWFNQAKFNDAGQMIECHSFAVDASAQREKEEALRGEKEEAESLSEQKSQFLAAVSHEIRNSVGAISNLARVIRDDAGSDDNREYADLIVSTGDSLVRILNDLIDHEKLIAGSLEIIPTRVDLTGIVNRLVELNRPVAAEKGLELKATVEPGLPEVEVDGYRFEQILFNLISNGVKFTRKGSVEVFLRLEKGDELPLVFGVNDTGVGVGAAQIEEIFTIYNRGSTETRHAFSGAGVGLTVCKQIVDLMKGRITVESEQGKGSTFTVRLPVEY